MFPGLQTCIHYSAYVQRHFMHCHSSRNLFKSYRSVISNMASCSSKSGSSGHRNRLAYEKSPYLLQHASNPVDWYPWGKEAFDRAKSENKPIFLSVGYSTCHWCHVMEHESFENPEIAKLMNENFVNIKVDREERIDVDKVYMAFVTATSHGGWPMSVWLTPDLKPIVGGTYFPPDDRYYGRPGFATILQHVAKKWRESPDQVSNQGTKILDALMLHSEIKAHGDSVPGTPAIMKCYHMLSESFDREKGGFGKAPKFPQPVMLNFLLQFHTLHPKRSDNHEALEMARHTMKCMANGGIHDHVGAGFHRYSTDDNWHVPHFEKMAYDQGQLLATYAEAYTLTKDDVLAEVTKDIARYVMECLSDPDGGFYSAEDADSLPALGAKKKKEGAFYVWTEKEIRQLLVEKVTEKHTSADLFCSYYGIKPDGNVSPYSDPHDELKHQNIPMITPNSLKDTARLCKISEDDVRVQLQKCRDCLYRERAKRPPPHLDTKIITAWNSLIISGLSKASQALHDDVYKNRAIKAANFISEHLYDSKSGTLLRSCYGSKETKRISQIDTPISGFSDDYAFCIQALLDLYEVCFDEKWLEMAVKLQGKMDDLFWDQDSAGYFQTTKSDRTILLHLKEDQDGAEPSGNSVAALNLFRLANVFQKQAWRDKATKILVLFNERLEKIPIALPQMMCAVILAGAHPHQIVICGERNAADTVELINAVHSYYIPNKVLLLADGKADGYVNKKVPFLQSLERKDGKATAYVCENYSCSLPVNSASALTEILSKK